MSYNFQKFITEKENLTNHLKKEYSAIQTGSANPKVLDIVTVEAYGAKSSIAHVATITVEGVSNLLILPYDKGLLKNIETAINEADLGLSTSADSSGLRVFFPKPTQESRQKMAKVIKEKLEEARVKIRSAREEIKRDITKLSADGELSRDDEKKDLEELQKLVDNANDEVEKLYQEKEKKILEI